MKIINDDAIRQLIKEVLNEALDLHIPKLSSAPSYKPVYTPSETMELLGISKRSLQYLRDVKAIGFIQHGRKIHFRSQDITEYLENNRVSRRKVA
jgi:hypothetical protein